MIDTQIQKHYLAMPVMARTRAAAAIAPPHWAIAMASALRGEMRWRSAAARQTCVITGGKSAEYLIGTIVNNHSSKNAPETIILNRSNKSKLEQTAGLTWAPEAARKTEVRAAKARPAASPRCS